MNISKVVMANIRWAFNTKQWQPTVSDWVSAAQCIQLEEKLRIGKFVFKKDAKSSMIGRLMLRKMLHRVTKIPYADIKLGRTEKGKPFLVNNVPEECGQLSFNVSHHGDYVVLAAETNVEVGVDVMKLETPVGTNSIPEFFRIMKRQFTDEEWVYIKSGDTERDQLGNFYRLWCLKESYVKALGVGIGYEVKRLNFNVHDTLPCTPHNTEVDQSVLDHYTMHKENTVVSSTTLKVDGELTTGWTFEETLLDNHCIAVALRSSVGEAKGAACFDMITFKELLEESKPLSEPDQTYGEQFVQKAESPAQLKKADT